MKRYYYMDGQEIRIGDKIRVACIADAVVVDIFQPLTKVAADHACFEDGGFVLHVAYEDNAVVSREIWIEADEDLELVERSVE